MVSVIIPIYKTNKSLLRDALNSLVAQTYKKPFTVTLSVDHDEVDYSDILKEFNEKLYIRVIDSGERKGPGHARQFGMNENQTADYYLFLDADDMLLPRALQCLVRAANENLADVVAGSFITEDGENNASVANVHTTSVTWCHGKLYRRTYLQSKNICFHPNIFYNEDSYFNFVAINAADKYVLVEEPVYLWRYNKASVTRGDGLKGFFEKSWKDYVVSQMNGLLTLAELKSFPKVETFAATLINIFEHCSIAHYFDLYEPKVGLFIQNGIQGLRINTTRETEEGLSNLVDEYIDSPEFWEYISNNLKGTITYDDNLIFPKPSFIEWFNEVRQWVI